MKTLTFFGICSYFIFSIKFLYACIYVQSSYTELSKATHCHSSRYMRYNEALAILWPNPDFLVGMASRMHGEELTPSDINPGMKVPEEVAVGIDLAMVLACLHIVDIADTAHHRGNAVEVSVALKARH